MNLDRLQTLLLLVPLLPLASCLLIALLAPTLLRRVRAFPSYLTVVAFGAAFICSLLLLNEVLRRTGEEGAFESVCTLWNWASIPAAGPAAADGVRPDLTLDVTLRADSLTVTMLCMVTMVATLVAVFASGYMQGDPGEWRFFCYVSLFVFSMVMLVSVSNFLLLFVFWEAVGLCSYLLIGFWYQKPEAAAAGKKAFLVNRVGDFGFALGLFLIWTTYGTLNFHDTRVDPDTGRAEFAAAPLANAEGTDALGESGESAAAGESSGELVSGVLGRSRLSAGYVGGGVATAICLLLLVGACGKSAQLPLHVWLPDAMEGPTPVSALIHAATMVTAGVYMVTRCSPLFMASPDAQLVVSVVGGVTALVAGVIAMTQFDLKRVLAYSTVSQLGYMFLSLGTGSFAGITAGMFHLFTHAFFKALLFLGSGSVMHAMGHVIDMRRFSGLRRIMPITRWTFLLGCLALSGVFPLAGFWSKDGIVAAVHDKVHSLSHTGEHGDAAAHGDEHTGADAEHEHAVATIGATDSTALAWRAHVYQCLYYVALIAAFLTPFYTFRAYLMTFHGELRVPPAAGHHAQESPQVMTAPLVVLAVCACVVGLFFDRTYLGTPQHLFANFLGSTPSLAHESVAATRHAPAFHFEVAALSSVIALAGIALAMYLYLGDRREAARWESFMRLEWAGKLFDVESVARRRQSPWVRGAMGDFERLHLGWLGRLVGSLVMLAALVLTLPLMLLQSLSPYKLSSRKFYFDELYDFFIVQPLRGLARVVYAIDRWLVDGVVNLVGAAPPTVGRLVRSWQNGLVQYYALAMAIGLLALLLAGMSWR